MCEAVFDIHGADKAVFIEELFCQVPQYQYWVSVDLLNLVVGQDLNEEEKTSKRFKTAQGWACTVLKLSQGEERGGRQMMKPARITEMEVWQDLCGARVPKGGN